MALQTWHFVCIYFLCLCLCLSFSVWDGLVALPTTVSGPGPAAAIGRRRFKSPPAHSQEPGLRRLAGHFPSHFPSHSPTQKGAWSAPRAAAGLHLPSRFCVALQVVLRVTFLWARERERERERERDRDRERERDPLHVCSISLSHWSDCRAAARALASISAARASATSLSSAMTSGRVRNTCRSASSLSLSLLSFSLPSLSVLSHPCPRP
jgi:hypothetical protein